MSAPTGSALDYKTGAAVLDGIHTDIVCQHFSDKLFIVLSQYEKIGTLVQVSKDITVTEIDITGPVTYTTSVLLGDDKPEVHALARGLAENINTNKPILFGLAIKEPSPKTLKGLNSLVTKYCVL